MNRFHSVLLVVLVIVGAIDAHAQYPAGQNSQQSVGGDITLSGTVVNSVTGEAIPRALVQMAGAQPRAVLADGSGKFAFDGLAEGQVMLIARKPGFFTDQELQRAARPMVVQVTDGMSPVTVTLTPAGIITGHITTSNGDPIENAAVRLKRRIIQDGRAQWVDQSGAQTDEDGAFRLANLMPGNYYFFAEGPRFGMAGREDAFAPAYYPGVSDMAGATPLRPQAGQALTVDFTLEREKTYRVGGVVTGIPAGQRAFVVLGGVGDQFTPSRTDLRQDDTTFEIRGVPAGTYTLRAESQHRPPFGGGFGGGKPPSQLPPHYTGSMQLNVNSDVTGITIALQPTANIPVSIRTDFTQTSNTGMDTPKPGSNPGVPRYVYVLLRGSDGRVYGAQVDEGGSMEFRDVEPGRYRVEFNNPGWNTYVASASFGNLDLLHDDLVISSGGEQQPIDIVVRDDASTISGTANCGDLQCWVLVVPDGSTAFPAQQVPVDSLGTFHSRSLAPGSYHVYAFDRIDGIEYASPEAMKAYSSHAETVVLTAGQKAQVTLELTKAVDQ